MVAFSKPQMVALHGIDKILPATAPGAFPNVVYFWDENIGFAQGDPVDGEYELYTTVDGGENWIEVDE